MHNNRGSSLTRETKGPILRMVGALLEHFKGEYEAQGKRENLASQGDVKSL